MSRASPPRPITGRMVFFMMVAFFGVVIGVNLIMMRLAIQTLPGTEVDSAYAPASPIEKEIATAPRPERAQLEGRCPCRSAAGRAARRCRSRRATMMAGRCPA